MKISQSELLSIRELYEGVMSHACHGLFFKEGEAFANSLAQLCKEGDDLLDSARKILIARGWVEDVVFKQDEVKVRGSIEVVEGNDLETCHRLRGMLSRLYQIRDGKRTNLVEVECRSVGDKECVFKLEAK